MQIVIEFSDIKYQWIKDNPLTYDSEYCEAIRNGTPLPKGHGRLIEVTDQLECELFTFTRYTGIDESPLEDATKIIDYAPTIIEADKGE